MQNSEICSKLYILSFTIVNSLYCKSLPCLYLFIIFKSSQTSYGLLTGKLQASYGLPAGKLQASYGLPAGKLQASYGLLAGKLQASYGLLAGKLQASYGLVKSMPNLEYISYIVGLSRGQQALSFFCLAPLLSIETPYLMKIP